ncbi:MHYT domain-containing protein [Actinoplanes sp. NBRC 103695]|uniref:MHYT domain-containing protein n=1 Tax=Actinoplanes sp. NBRC 103695 TaxID=3032202 RepID=UPI0024A2888C|nr:MHYT domain-containing protein [Actinoplanes sp. NBRC 103695]GLY96732.1 membrane protein [Actinoplanes sp. NBRC 103695]
MAEVHHFTYGVFNPIAAFLLAFLGSFLGLVCTGRARSARTRSRRNRWLMIAAFSIGGAAIWLMHFTAMLGFDVPASPVRFDVALTMVSLGLCVLTVGVGLMVVGHGRRSFGKTAVAGVLTGAGIVAMHYTGMAGLHVSGDLSFRMPLVVASAIIAVVAATAALWFTQLVKGWVPITGAAVVMAIAVCGMHYTAMAATTVKLTPVPPEGISGIRPLLMIVPITVVTAATILAMALSALQAMTEEVFTDGAGTPKRGVHAENPWSLKQASALAMRRSRPSPSPRPIPTRPAPTSKPPVEAATTATS